MTPRQSAMFDLLEEMDRAEIKHGPWDSYSPFDVQVAVSGEYCEYSLAVIANDIHGLHGQRRELLQLACVAMRGYTRLAEVGR